MGNNQTKPYPKKPKPNTKKPELWYTENNMPPNSKKRPLPSLVSSPSKRKSVVPIIDLTPSSDDDDTTSSDDERTSSTIKIVSTNGTDKTIIADDDDDLSLASLSLPPPSKKEIVSTYGTDETIIADDDDDLSLASLSLSLPPSPSQQKIRTTKKLQRRSRYGLPVNPLPPNLSEILGPDIYSLNVRGDGSCFYHALFIAKDTENRKVKKSDRDKLAHQFRRELAKKTTFEIYKLVLGA